MGECEAFALLLPPLYTYPGVEGAWVALCLASLRFLATPLGRTKQSQLLDCEHLFCFDCQVLFSQSPKQPSSRDSPWLILIVLTKRVF